MAVEMERIIKDDTPVDFEISLLVNHNIFPLADVLGNKLNFTFKNRTVGISLYEHRIPFQHRPLFAQQSVGFGLGVSLLEFEITIPIDYEFFIKKMARYGSSMTEDILNERPHWEHIAISTVLRHLSLEIINRFLDSYRLLTVSVLLPPITENSILHLSYQAISGNSAYSLEDVKIGIKKLHQEPSGDFLPQLESYMSQEAPQYPYVMDIFNAIRLFESGYYARSICQVIDGFHQYLDHLIDKYITNVALKARIDDSPWEYSSADKVGWIFEMLFGKTLKDLSEGLNMQELYSDYAEYRNKRNDIVHPYPTPPRGVPYEQAKRACLSILRLIWRLRKEIEGEESYTDLPFALEMYLTKLSDST